MQDTRRFALLVLCGTVLPGCAQQSQIHLTQSQLTGVQHQLSLTTEQAWWTITNGTLRVLAEFPLPGALTGRPTYLLYLQMPAGVQEPRVGGTLLPTSRGFFIQTRGEFAGRADIVGGKLAVTGTSQARGAPRELQLDLICEDKSTIVGRIAALRDDWRVGLYERERGAADVKALSSPVLHPEAPKGAGR